VDTGENRPITETEILNRNCGASFRTILKEVSLTRDFRIQQVFSQINFPWLLRPFQFFSKIRGDIHLYVFIASVNKLFIVFNDTGVVGVVVTRGKLLSVSLTWMTNPCSGFSSIPMTSAINLSPVTMTLAIIYRR
jgi:hypothetical protein